MNDYFSSTYAEARQKLLKKANTLNLHVFSYENPQKGPHGEDLCTDVVRIGAEDASRVLIVESSLHGLEGYAGSAVQLAVLDAVSLDPADDTALVIVHAINPWGFAWNRRFNEDNIDLNRHFIDWEDPGELDNPGYRELADVLIPSRPTQEALDAGEARFEAYKAEKGEKQFRTAIKSGQYSHPDGLFYGGLKPSWSALTVQNIADTYLANARWAALIDIHTGLGPFGFGECLSDVEPDSVEGKRTTEWYGKVAHTRSPKTAYAGNTASILHGYKRAAPDKIWTSIGLEYGTRDEKFVRDSVRLDGWLHLNGQMNNPHAAEIKARLLSAFYPSEPEWRAAVPARGVEVVRQGLAGLKSQH